MTYAATELGLGWEERKASLKLDIKPDHLQAFSPDEIDAGVSFEPCLTNVVYNLVENSADHCSPDRDLEITVRTRRRREKVFLDVQDNGPGISALEKRRVNASALPRHLRSNLAKAVDMTAVLGGSMFAQNVVNGQTGRIKGLRVTAEFRQQQEEKREEEGAS